MTLPQLRKPTDFLNTVKDKLLATEKNIEELTQTQYKSSIGLPSFKTQSFILYKKYEDDNLYIVKTDNEVITPLSLDEFKTTFSKLPSFEQERISHVLNRVENKLEHKAPKN